MFRYIEGALDAASLGTSELQAGAPRDELKMVVVVLGGRSLIKMKQRSKASIENRKTQLSGTQFDKIMTRYEDWEVLSRPSVYFDRELLCIPLGTKRLPT